MPELSLAQIIMLSCVVVFTIVTAISDIRTRKIPNKLTAPMCVAGFVWQISFFGLDGLWAALAGFAAGFGIFFVLWMIGAAGGGDVKLLGALGPWLGGMTTLKVLFVSLVFVTLGAGFVVVAGILKRGFRKTKDQYLKQATSGTSGKRSQAETLEQRKKRRVMAFAAPVALATWCVLALQLFGTRGL